MCAIFSVRCQGSRSSGASALSGRRAAAPGSLPAARLARAFCSLLLLSLLPIGWAGAGEVIFRDDFDGSMQPDWTWVRQNPATWQLTATDLRIELEYGDLWSTYTNNCRNLLIRTAPTDDFTIEAHLTASLVANINQAHILLYANDDNYLRYGLLRYQGNLFVNNVLEVTGSPRPQTSHAYGSPEVYLRIQRQGSGATMWYSADSLTWAEHLTIASLDFTPASVGLVAFDGSEPASASVACYDYFTIRSDVQSGITGFEADGARPLLAARRNPTGSRGPVRLDFITSSPGRITLRAFDARGALVATILDRDLPAGEHTADWRREDMRTGTGAPAGIYFVAMSGGGASATTRVLLIR